MEIKSFEKSIRHEMCFKIHTEGGFFEEFWRFQKLVTAHAHLSLTM